MMNKKIYLTTTLPYVNAYPHIGFALEVVQADTVARYYRALGYEVFFNIGTDEHGLKIYRAAEKEGKDVLKYCDEKARKYLELKEILNLSFNSFIRTTEEHHLKASQEFWTRCLKNGDIYKKNYKIKYCVGCELEKTDSEIVEGKCPVHPNLDLEIIEEENYFFKFSRYQKTLLDLYKKQSGFVIPANRQKEIENFVSKGLEDFSISRLKNKMPWGVPVPNDQEQVMYVWFDALINYISAIGWPSDLHKFNEWWPVAQFAGKDNLRQQSAMWQAMLASAELPFSRQIFIHGFITSGGQKISKSLGNVIDPFEMVKKYGTDAIRYYLLREIPAYDDGDFSERRLVELYNADLANGLGNLIARIARLAESAKFKVQSAKSQLKVKNYSEYNSLFTQYRFNEILEWIWGKVTEANRHIDNNEPWKLTGEKQAEVLSNSVNNILEIAALLIPFLPKTAEKILSQFTSSEIKVQPVLFPRIK